MSKPKLYRDVIDELVRVCLEGQGQIGAKRARVGVWNAKATPNSFPEQHAMNELLSRLDKPQREALAQILSEEVQLGVFETLKALEAFEVYPFQEGYEGAPYHDFVGRLRGWKWPEK